MRKIENITFNQSRAIRIQTGKAELTAVSDIGPRIAFFGRPGGNNLLLWEPGKHCRGDWDLRGGHRVWPARPMADESEDNYRPDNLACEEIMHDQGFTLLAPVDPITRTQRGFSVSCLNDTLFEVDNFIINRGDMLYSTGVWALTCTLPTPECSYIAPVGDGGEWDTFSMVFFRCWAGHGSDSFADSQIRLTDDQLVIEPRGKETKRMFQAHRGVLALRDPENDLIFAKKSAYDPAGNYPLGCNMALYIGPDNFMVEMETMGEQKTLKPGEEVHHTESWLLHPSCPPLKKAADTVELFRQ